MSRIADDYFFIAHDDRSGRGRLAAPVVNLGLAAALFAELILSGHVTIHEGELYPLHPAPADGQLQSDILNLLIGRPQDRDLGAWLTFLAAEAVTDVGERMASDGLVGRVKRRRLGGSRIEYVPTDITVAAWPAIRVAGILTRGEEITLNDAVLTGLVNATGLISHVLWDGELHRPGFANVEPLLAALPPAFAALLTRTQVAVGDVVLTKRG